jgi:hypothetical protein
MKKIKLYRSKEIFSQTNKEQEEIEFFQAKLAKSRHKGSV